MIDSIAAEPPPMAAGASPLERLWEREPDLVGQARGRDMPAALERRYAGRLLVPLRADRPAVVANFVSTLDGIVALGGGDLSGGGKISGFHEPDRFVMALLRALADVVVVGAGTLRGSTDHRWTPEHIHPRSAASLGEWRTSMGLAAVPTTMFVTGSGEIPLGHGALRDPGVPVVIATTASGAARLARAALGDHVTVEATGTGTALSAQDIVAIGAGLGARLILTEGGPHLLGQFVAADLLDELFLTLAPQVAGRGEGERLGLVEGVALSPPDMHWHELVSVRRSTDHLLLRYRRRGDRLQPRES